MIISNSHAFIFVHILKTAGTSVCAALDTTLRWNDVMLGGTTFGEQLNGPYKERFGLRKHSTAAEIRAVVGADVWSRYVTFSFVRHPYTRVASFYTWLESTIRRSTDQHAPVRSWTTTQAYIESHNFSEFIRNDKFLQTMAAWPQLKWIGDADGRCIVDVVGRFEDLEGGMRMLSERLGVALPPLARHNPSPLDRPIGELFANEADYEFLHGLHACDFDLFGYDPSLRFPCPAH